MDLSKLHRKLLRAEAAGDDARMAGLRARLAEAERDAAAAAALEASAAAAARVDDGGGDVDASTRKLRRKLARAAARGDDARVAGLRARLAEAERDAAAAAALEASAAAAARVDDDGDVDASTRKLRRKLARAAARGDDARVADLQSRLAVAQAVCGGAGDVLGAGVAAAGVAAAGAGLSSAGVGVGAGTGGGAGAGARAGAAAGGSATMEGVEGSREGMVLAKNGKWYPAPVPATGNTSLLLFYAYVQPPWTPAARAAAIDFTRSTLEAHGCTGRLRVALEGFNGTLSGPAGGIRAFCAQLSQYDPRHFGNIDFKIVDALPDNKAFRNLKVWPVDALVNYGFDADAAPLDAGGTHVKPAAWTALAAQPGAVMVDVRNANESAIGRFAPPPGGAELLDPHMRRSTEFGEWVDANLDKLKGAEKVLMYCTAGIRCERASALLAAKGVPRDSIFQLDGGIHRYLDAYPEDGGIWAGKNYTFDKRFAHGAASAVVVGRCVACAGPWERYQAQAKCGSCKMEVLLCRDCERSKGGVKAMRLACSLCAGSAGDAAATARARAFAAAGGKDGEGEGRVVADEDAPVVGGKRRR